MNNKMIIVSLFACNFINCLTIDNKPLFSITLPASTMENISSDFRLQVKESKSRYSTCTSVSWFDEHTLIISNLYDKSIYVYRINGSHAEIVQVMQNLNGNPELDHVSKDKKYYAVSLYDHVPLKESRAKINLYSLSPDSQLHFLKTIQGINGEYNTHGVRFSPSCQFLAYTTINRPGYIHMCKKKEGTDNFEFCSSLENVFYPLKPKGIDFSPDSRYLAAVYSLRASTIANNTIAAVATFKFDAQGGSLNPQPVFYSQSLDLDVPENIAFHPNGSHIFISNQGNDSIVVYAFDSSTGHILHKECALTNPDAQLSFPHGFSISPDGNYLAVCNYGHNRVTIHKIDLH